MRLQKPHLPTHDTNLRLAVFAIVFGVFVASLSDAFIKFVSADFQLWQIFVLRSVITIPVLCAIIKFRDPSVPLAPVNFRWTTLRSLLLVFMWLAFYAALPRVELSVAGAVYYTLPLFITLFAGVFVGEKVGVKGWIAIAIGFVGVLLILKPQADHFNAYALLPLASAVFYASAMILTRTKIRNENALVLALSLNVAFLLVGASGTLVVALWSPTSAQAGANPFLLGEWSTLGLQEWMTIAVLAVLITTSSLCATIAYQNGPSSTVSSFDFFYLAFVVMWGVLFLGEVPDAVTVTGIILIACAGVVVVGKQWRKPMPAYVIFQENVFDKDTFDEYKKISPVSVEKFGGRFVVRGGPIEILEGAMAFERVVIIEFPTTDAARTWHGSAEYAPAMALRQKISKGDAILVEGV